jgi:hypothetical protein
MAICEVSIVIPGKEEQNMIAGKNSILSLAKCGLYPH